MFTDNPKNSTIIVQIMGGKKRMKYMIASDIHGSAFYCRRMLRLMKEEAADRLLILGDLLYHGPRHSLPKEYAPKEVISHVE